MHGLIMDELRTKHIVESLAEGKVIKTVTWKGISEFKRSERPRGNREFYSRILGAH